MSELVFRLVFIGLMKCTFTSDNPKVIRECQEKIYRETLEEEYGQNKKSATESQKEKSYGLPSYPTKL